jgi:hypothetical protein
MGCAACMRMIRNVYNVLDGKSEGKTCGGGNATT